MEEDVKWMSYVMMDPETKHFRTYTRPMDEAMDAAPNAKSYIKMFEASSAEQCFEMAQEFIQEYLENQPVDFRQIRMDGYKMAYDAKDSYVEYEDGSILPIVPNDELEKYKKLMGIEE